MMQKVLRINCKGHVDLDIDTLVPSQGNLKTLSKKAYEAFKRQLEKNGFVQPFNVCQWDGKNNIGDGHQRLLVLKGMRSEGWLIPQKLPCNLFFAKTKKEMDLILMALASQYGEVTSDGLYEFMSQASIDLSELENFRFPEIDPDKFFSEFLEENEVVEDETPEIPTEPVTKVGDLYQLGKHRLLCADSLEEKNYSRLVGEKEIDLIFTDPPYNYADEMSKEFYKNTNSSAMKKLSVSEWDQGFDISKFLHCVTPFVPKNGTVYVCTSHTLAPDIWSWMKKQNPTHHSYCVWVKPNPMPSLAKRHFTWATELICYATFGKHTFNFPNDGHSLSWWEVKKNQKNEHHPTQKPIEIPSIAIKSSSKINDIILDPFLGSGTTLLAAEQLGRVCYGLELDPGYCDVIVKRWEDLTGLKAEKIAL